MDHRPSRINDPESMTYVTTHTNVVRNVKLYISVYVTLTSSLDESGTYIESAVRDHCTQRERFKYSSLFFILPLFR